MFKLKLFFTPKVSKHDATEVERPLTVNGKLFEKWSQGCEVTRATKIPIEKMKAYLDHLEDEYEGIVTSRASFLYFVSRVVYL